MNQKQRAILAIVSLGLIAGGAGWIYPPLAPLAIGCLLWYDLNREASASRPPPQGRADPGRRSIPGAGAGP